ncbi:MAG: histidinol-phosphate transaminase [Pseudomonadota bacterium]
MSQFWSDIVHQLQPYTPGEQPQIDGIIKLNTNESPYPPSDKVLAAIAAANSADLRKYPDPNASALKRCLAESTDLKPKQVFVGNSSDEVLGHAFRGLLKQHKPLLFPDLTYSFYPVYCGLFEINFEEIPLNESFEIDIRDYERDAGAIIFANPNAPTGIHLPLAQIEALCQMHRNAVIVVDEAYADFAGQSATSLVNKYDNLLVTQTLSKSRALAGLRVGMAFGHADLIEALERVKNCFHPYALDRLALAGAEAALKDQAYFADSVAKINATRKTTIETLEGLGFSVLPSQANFVLVSHESSSAESLFQRLRDHKIIVRHFKHPRISNYLRISIGTNEEMQALFDVLSQALQ